MSTQGIIKRYSLIVNFVRQRQKPSKAEILKMLHAEGHEIDKRSFDRYLAAIRNEYGIEITFDRYANGYFIDYENSLNFKYILRFFEMANSAQVMIDTIKDGKSALKYLSLDSSENLTGIELMEPLMKALKSNRIVTFDYFNFQSEKTSQNTVRPYLLKEYQNRWFLYGENEKFGDCRIYGLERISNLVITDTTFEPKKDFEPAKDFENIIGVTLRSFEKDYPVQDIVLSMTREQSRYFKTLPWHPNHTVLIDSEDEFRVSLHILPNYEFMQQIYRYCDKITVVEPRWLRDYLKAKFKTSSEKY